MDFIELTLVNEAPAPSVGFALFKPGVTGLSPLNKNHQRVIICIMQKRNYLKPQTLNK